MYIDIQPLHLILKKKILNVSDLLNEKNKYYIIGGDININLFNRDQRTFDYLECISSAGALQFVDSPTRYSADYSSSSLIDHIYSNFDYKKLNVNVMDYDISYHMPVIREIKCKMSKMNIVI